MPFGKGMNPTILALTMGKIVGQTKIFSLGMANGQRDGKLFIQICMKNQPFVESCLCGMVG